MVRGEGLKVFYYFALNSFGQIREKRRVLINCQTKRFAEAERLIENYLLMVFEWFLIRFMFFIDIIL